MNKIFKKVLASFMAIAIAMTLLGPSGFVKTVKADEEVALAPWSFYQTGTSTYSWNQWELCAFQGVTFGDGVPALTATDFSHKPTSAPSGYDEKTVTAKGASSSFDAAIESNGWSANYDAQRNSPYTVTADMTIDVKEGHDYVISFKAKATKKKYFQIGAIDSSAINHIVDIDTNEAYPTQELGTTDRDFSFNMFWNNPDDKTAKVTISLGAFPFEDGVVKFDTINDWGNAASSDVNWSGTVSVSEFKIVDKGLRVET